MALFIMRIAGHSHTIIASIEKFNPFRYFWGPKQKIPFLILPPTFLLKNKENKENAKDFSVMTSTLCACHSAAHKRKGTGDDTLVTKPLRLHTHTHNTLTSLSNANHFSLLFSFLSPHLV
jgi:hypothetical protein